MVPAMGLIKERLDVHAVYVPEGKFDVEAEGKRLKPIMDKYGNINIFISEGAGKDYIIEEMEAEGKTVPRDAFGHAKLDSVNVGKYYGDKLGALIGDADQHLAQHGPDRGLAVAAAGERRAARSLEGDVASASLPVDHLAEQQRSAIAELRREPTELVARIHLRQRLGDTDLPAAIVVDEKGVLW